MYLAKLLLNCFEISVIKRILTIERISPSELEKIETSTDLTVVNGAVIIVHKKLV